MGQPADAAGGFVTRGPTPASVCPAGSGSPRTGVGIWGAFHCGRVLAMAPATDVSEVGGVGKFTTCPRPVEVLTVSRQAPSVTGQLHWRRAATSRPRSGWSPSPGSPTVWRRSNRPLRTRQHLTRAGRHRGERHAEGDNLIREQVRSSVQRGAGRRLRRSSLEPTWPVPSWAGGQVGVAGADGLCDRGRGGDRGAWVADRDGVVGFVDDRVQGVLRDCGRLELQVGPRITKSAGAWSCPRRPCATTCRPSSPNCNTPDRATAIVKA
jgi:hypothetical protein